ncbi:A/G-specific adenine glycosylase [Actinomarinicola tropica]|uniref:Adenine DNA glycosylase n=2 Tax=Actinomarinicola tropica TaxID=2789776 RepID=A0A5Q2RSF2_9ACTN|nr:A/G-specific adenine glycosylase [Actinomarinicola tropica]
MAQQTGVDRVVPKWHAFLERWPDPTALAARPLGDLLSLWSGLGYPRRARNLHLAAQQMVDEHGGAVPDDLDALLRLPGVGPYTARAVLAFAFERDVGLVDTNIARVLARVGGASLRPRAAQDAADGLVPADRGWLWNQSLMELGATFCRPTPRCVGCPAHPDCAWATAGRPDPDPAAGSAGVSRRQAPFAGSDREARGRVLAALVDAPLADDAARAIAAGVVESGVRAEQVVDGLRRDGLVVRREDGTLALP